VDDFGIQPDRRVIPLLSQNGEHLGFLLPASLPEDFASTTGEWEGECIFMALPLDSEMFEEDAFAVLEGHKHAGEHHLAVANDGTTLSFVATAPTGEQIYVHLPGDSPTGTWGTLESGTGTLLGHAIRISN